MKACFYYSWKLQRCIAPGSWALSWGPLCIQGSAVPMADRFRRMLHSLCTPQALPARVKDLLAIWVTISRHEERGWNEAGCYHIVTMSKKMAELNNVGRRTFWWEIGRHHPIFSYSLLPTSVANVRQERSAACKTPWTHSPSLPVDSLLWLPLLNATNGRPLGRCPVRHSKPANTSAFVLFQAS